MISMNSEEDGSVIGYMCSIAWECELGMASGGTTVYPSISDLKSNHPTCTECGIVKVQTFFVEEILKGNGF